MNDLAVSLRAHIIASNGCRTFGLLRAFPQVDSSLLWAALDTIEGVEHMDVGDDDCPKDFVYIRRSV